MKFCKDCKFYNSGDCLNEAYTREDKVTGQYPPTAREARSWTLCSEEAFGFEPKPTVADWVRSILRIG